MFDVALEIVVDKSAIAAALPGRTTVNVIYDRVQEDSEKGRSASYRAFLRPTLARNLHLSTVLPDALPGGSVSLTFVASNGTTLPSKDLVLPDKGPLHVVLSQQDVDALAMPRPHVVPPLARRPAARQVRFVQSSATVPDYRASKVYYGIVATRQWKELKLTDLFGSADPVSTSIEWNDSDLGWGGSKAVNWQLAKVGVGGLFEANLPADKDLVLLWWLQGPQSALGAVAPDMINADAQTPIPATLPPFVPQKTSLLNAEVCPACIKPVPMGTSERDLVENPDVYREDAGTFCKPFGNPERVLSERAFFTIVRVEQPDVSASATSTGHGTIRTGRCEVDQVQRVPWDAEGVDQQAISVARGHILEHRVRWRSNGYSLGTVAKTLTLAPRQAKRIQKVDWQRRESSQRSESTQQSDAVQDSVVRERSYDDSVEASLHEWSFGTSAAAAGGVAAGIGFFASGVLGGVGGAAGGAASAAYQTSGRTTAAREEQNLRDSIRRFADSSRRLNSIAVTEVSQDETVTSTTEVLRNFNYAHSLTVIYYQILRHLRVETAFAGVSECLFVPLWMSPFTKESANRWRESLAASVRDPVFQRALKLLPDVVSDFATSNIPPHERYKQPMRWLRGSVYLTLAIERPSDGDEGSGDVVDQAGNAVFNPAGWKVLRPILGQPARAVHETLSGMVRQERDRFFQSNFAVGIAGNWCDSLKFSDQRLTNVDFTLATPYRYRGTVRVDFTADIRSGLTRGEIQSLVLLAGRDLPPGSVANMTGMSITYATDNFEYTVRDAGGVRDLIHVETGDIDTRGAKAQLPVTAWEQVDQRAEATQAVTELVRHLNAHVEYYHKAIWWGMDRDRLFMALDGFVVPGTVGVSLSSVVEREPIGIIGNALVYRVTAGVYLDDPVELYKLYADSQPPRDPMHVSLPTDGLYAQTLLDPCGALEEHYGNFDWPLAQPDLDPGTLTPDLLASRRADPGTALAPSPMPQTLINLQNAPDAPAPSGLQGILGAVTKADSFRDLTGLAGNQANALAALQAASSLATNFGNQAASLQMAQLAGKVHATNTADRQIATIQRAKDKNLISEPDASSATNKVIAAMHQDKDPPTPPFHDPEIRQVITSAKGVPGSTVEATSADGTVRVSVGDAGGQIEPGSAGDAGDQGNPSGWLLGLAHEAVDIGVKCLRDWRASSENPFDKLLQDALIEEAKKQATNAVGSLPCGNALVEAFKVSLAFAQGVGEELRNTNVALKQRYDIETGQVGDELDMRAVDGIADLTRYQLNAVSSLQTLVAAGMRKALDAAITDLTSGLGKILKNGRNSLIRNIANDSTFLATVDGLVESVAANTNPILQRMLAYMVRAFVKQLRKGRFKTALDTVVSSVKGTSHFATEVVAGLCMVVLDLEGGALKQLLGPLAPDVRAMLIEEARYWVGMGTHPIESTTGPIEIRTQKLALPAALKAELETQTPAIALPTDEVETLIDTFVNVRSGYELELQEFARAEAVKAKAGKQTYHDAGAKIEDKNYTIYALVRAAYESLYAALDGYPEATTGAKAGQAQVAQWLSDFGCAKGFNGVRWDNTGSPNPDPDSWPEPYWRPL